MPSYLHFLFRNGILVLFLSISLLFGQNQQEPAEPPFAREKNYVSNYNFSMLEGDEAFSIGNYKLAQDHYNRALETAKSARDNNKQGFANYKMALAINVGDNSPEAIKYLIPNVKNEQITNKNYKIDSYGLLAEIYARSFKYQDAFEYQYKAYELIKQERDSLRLRACLLKLGSYQASLDKPKSAIPFFTEALSLRDFYLPSRWRMTFLLELGRIYSVIGDYDKATDTFNEGLNLVNSQPTPQKYDLANLYLQRGKNAVLNDEPRQAASDFNQALELVNSDTDPSLSVLSIDIDLELAELMLSENKPLAAIKKLKTISQALIMDVTEKEMEVFLKLYRAYKALGRTDSALFYLESYEETRKRSVREEILQESKIEMTRERISLDITEKEVIEQQAEDLIKFQQDEISRRDNRENIIFRIASVLSFLVLVVVIYLLYMRYQIQTKSHSELTASKLEIEIQNKKLKHSNEALEQFAYAASHDMLEPLRMIGNYTSLIEHKFKGKLEADALEFLGFISDAVKRMKRLLTELLDYSRMSNDNMELEIVNLNTLITSILRTLSLPIEEKKAIILIDDLPRIYGSETQLFQLFQNFISNALKFSSEGTPEIQIGSFEDEEGKVVFVKDNGIGIAKEHFDKIFSLFQRLHSHETFPGTGIGLAINKRIVDNHQGEIWLDSEEGKGTTFFVRFPFSKPNPAA